MTHLEKRIEFIDKIARELELLLTATSEELYVGENPDIGEDVNWQAAKARNVCQQLLLAAKVRTYGGCLFCQG